jgi:hypothetical protein
VTRWVRVQPSEPPPFAAHPVTALITHFGGRDDEASQFEKEAVLVTQALLPLMVIVVVGLLIGR